MPWLRGTLPGMPCCTSRTRQEARAWRGGTDRIVIYQATGMIAAQLDDTVSDALARLRAAAFASGRPVYDIAQDVVERRVRFDE
jgi:AmiR/NasT family two-component response regulator